MRGSDELFVLPERMRAEVIRRRGDEGAYVPPTEALEVYLQRQQDGRRRADRFLTAALAGAHSDTALLAEIRRPGFDDPAQASPLQAALAATLILSAGDVRRGPDAGFVESWVLGRGHGYAMRALAELYDVHATWMQSGGSQSNQGFVRGVVEDLWVPDLWLMARRMLELLAGASEAGYREVLAAAREYRGAAGAQRALTSFLFPDRTEWVDADIAEVIPPGNGQGLTCYLLVCAITEGRQVVEFLRRQSWLSWPRHTGPLETLLASVGAGAVPLLVTWLDKGHHYQDARSRLLALLSSFDSDGAIRALIERIATKDGQHTVLTVGDRFPGRTLRLLAETDPVSGGGRSEDGEAGDGDFQVLWSRQVALALRLLANVHRNDAEAVIPELDSAARDRLAAALIPAGGLSEVAADRVPPILVRPPWLNRGSGAKPAVIKGLTPPAGASVVWTEGERERWAATPFVERRHRDEPDDTVLAGLFAKGEAFPGPVNLSRFCCRADDALVRPLLEAGWQPNNLWLAQSWGRVYLARFELLALPMTCLLKAPERLELVGPFRSPETAAFIADTFARGKSRRAAAAQWLSRHPEYAAEQLIPAAVGKPGKSRQAAADTVRWLGAQGLADVVAIAADSYGDEAAAAIKALMESDGAEDVPRTMPGLPHWAEPFALPQITVLGALGSSDASKAPKAPDAPGVSGVSGAPAVLPTEAVRHVVQMLSISKADAPYPGLRAVRESCDPASLRDFAWALFENWQLAGYPSASAWVFDGLRWFGDDDTVRRLEPLIRAWPGENGHARSVTGLDVLAGIGSDTALAAIYRISLRVKFKALKDRAAEKIAEIADESGLSSEQLGDRLVPDLGLDPDGRMRLDFGPRRFVVGFDELLKPYVRDEAGQRLKALPKPGVKDDAELAKDATDRFSVLKREARAVTSDQIARLERAMCLRRRWSSPDFRSYFVGHPLVSHLVRRLVWGSYDEDGNLLATFRIAEDLTFADLDDDPFEAEIATVGLVHPLELGELVPRWSDVLADYEILQPFEQLGRRTLALTDAERASAGLTRFQDVEVPAGKLVGLTRRGWRRGEAWDNGVETHILRPLPDGRALIVNIDPGISVGAIAESGPQELTDVWIARDGVADWRPRAQAVDPFGTLDPVTASEILRDLTEATDLTGATA